MWRLFHSRYRAVPQRRPEPVRCRPFAASAPKDLARAMGCDRHERPPDRRRKSQPTAEPYVLPDLSVSTVEERIEEADVVRAHPLVATVTGEHDRSAHPVARIHVDHGVREWG